MTVADAVAEKLRSLPADDQRRVLEFVDSLLPSSPTTSRRSLEGLLAHLVSDISADEIDESRREMLAGFPRDDF